MPWYVRVVVGISAWVTALVALALGLAIVLLIFNTKNLYIVSFLGIVFAWLGLYLVADGKQSIFRTQIGIAIAAAGAVMLSAGVTIESKSIWQGAALAIIAAASITWFGRDAILQFLVTLLAGGFLIAALLDGRYPYAFDVAALIVPLGVFLVRLPHQFDIDLDLKPAGTALLILFPLATLLDYGYRLEEPSFIVEPGTYARLISIAVLGWLLWSFAEERGGVQKLPSTFAFAVVAIAICYLLPAGGSASLAILALAYVSGSKPFAATGAVLTAVFITRFYYDMDATLLMKSYILLGVGAMLMGFWWAVARKHRSETSE